MRMMRFAAVCAVLLARTGAFGASLLLTSEAVAVPGGPEAATARLSSVEQV
ncbi:hypothetical protein [Chenggangzhangella methanolivorans]|uniref:Uncharacterized protein n=1 Tax=Chenggangzhangella methanolivorans TaxID=1437009 RepID=A0A9E6UQP1_9HYPH|nr:hypothetical protein [Chenggangzhangella methanolivorans]QZO01250.1 hypothetical protein K6K41_06895 [Chenggangzhangella methanolivorans]